MSLEPIFILTHDVYVSVSTPDTSEHSFPLFLLPFSKIF